MNKGEREEERKKERRRLGWMNKFLVMSSKIILSVILWSKLPWLLVENSQVMYFFPKYCRWTQISISDFQV